jgi:uncharacterized protein (TIGR03083 family)
VTSPPEPRGRSADDAIPEHGEPEALDLRDGGPEVLDRAGLDRLIAQAAVDACEPSERAALEAGLRDHPDLAAEQDRLQAVAGLLGALESAPPQPSLRPRVLAEAFRRRPPSRLPASGRAGATDDGTVAGLYREVVDDLDATLDALTDADWRTPTVAEGWDVLGVVGHLCGVEELMLRRLDHIDDWTPEEFLAASTAGVGRAQADGPAATRARWRALAAAVLDHPALSPAGAGRGPASLWDGDDAPRRQSLVVRAFEIWNHAEDVRRAIGRPLVTPGPQHYHLMAELGVRSLPLMMDLRGRTHPGRSARVVLTGPGGGEWLIPLAPGETPSVPAVILTLDVVEFCFRVADRRRPEELSTRVGVVDATDPDEADRLVTDLLASASALARP